MKAYPPTAITDAMLIATDVTEADYPEFEMGATYGVGDRRMDTTGGEILTLDVAPATDWAAGDLLTGQTSTKTCRAVAKLTSLTYQVRERTGAFTLGEVIGVTGEGAKLADQGAAHPTITAAADKVHKIYESLKAANTGNYPPDNLTAVDPDVPWWMEVEPTNRWKVFDEMVGSQTSKSASMYYTLAPGMIDSLTLLKLDATEVQVAMTDLTEGEVYSDTGDLISTANVIDGYTYCFDPIIRKTDEVFLNLPPYGSATITITITNTGGTAKCGAIFVGMCRNLGTTLRSTSVGITSYSTKAVDVYGNYSLVPRANAKRGSYEVEIQDALIDEIFRWLTEHCDTIVVWIGIVGKTSTYSCGFYKDWGIPIEGPLRSVCSIEIEGLT